MKFPERAIDFLKSFSQLGHREREALVGRAQKLTLEALGQEFGVTKERIRQIEAKAFQKLIEGGK